MGLMLAMLDGYPISRLEVDNEGLCLLRLRLVLLMPAKVFLMFLD
jgi:hypothetical protein